jgi:hypothetical protein
LDTTDKVTLEGISFIIRLPTHSFSTSDPDGNGYYEIARPEIWKTNVLDRGWKIVTLPLQRVTHAGLVV